MLTKASLTSKKSAAGWKEAKTFLTEYVVELSRDKSGNTEQALLLLAGGTIANPSTTKVNQIVRCSKTKDRVRSLSLLMENVIIVPRKVTGKAMASKGKTTVRDQ